MKIYSLSSLYALLTIFEVIACQSHANQDKKKETIKNRENTIVEKNSLLDSAHFFFDNRKDLQAIKYYNLLIKNDSMQGAYFYERGTCKMYEFDSLGALSDYRRAEFLNYPKKKYLYLNMAALLLFNFSKCDSAIYYYDAVLKEDPYNEKALRGKIFAIQLKDRKKH